MFENKATLTVVNKFNGGGGVFDNNRFFPGPGFQQDFTETFLSGGKSQAGAGVDDFR